MTRVIGTTVVIITEEIEGVKDAATLIVAGVRSAKDTIVTVVCVGGENTPGGVLAGVVGTSNAVIAVSVYGGEFTPAEGPGCGIACIQGTVHAVITETVVCIEHAAD